MNKAEKQDAKVFLVFSRGYTVENGPWPRIRHISPIQPIQSKWKRNPLDVFIAKLLNKFADKLFYEWIRVVIINSDGMKSIYYILSLVSH